MPKDRRPEESKFTIQCRLAHEIFESKYAKSISELYKQAADLKAKLQQLNEISKQSIFEKGPKEQRDDQLTAMALKPEIFNKLPEVLCKIRLVQIQFEADVLKQYEKQAYNKKGSSTPLEEDALWVSVLPEEIADLIPNLIAECPNEVIARYKLLLDKKKKPVNESLQPLIDAVVGSKLMTSQNMSKMLGSSRVTESLRQSQRNSIMNMSISKLGKSEVAKSKNK